VDFNSYFLSAEVISLKFMLRNSLWTEGHLSGPTFNL
jgi:hypothetical protein